jgi:ribonuclease Z
MFLKIIFLGTSGTVPSIERNLSSILINYNGEKILFDCGEGTQRQMMIAKTGFRKLNNIFITHLHTDHFAGVFGLLETMSLNDRQEKISFYSPYSEFLAAMFKMFGYDHFDFPIEVYEVKDGAIFEFNGFKVQAFKTDHLIESYGYVFIENPRPGKFNREKAEALGIPPGPLYSKLVRGEAIELDGKIITPEMVVGPKRSGRKIVYTGDTRPVEKIVEVAKNADVLIHDASFTEELINWARETKHSTAREAAEIAKKANVGSLILTHISTRYSKDATPLLEEAKKIFKNTFVAEDFMVIDVPLKS